MHSGMMPWCTHLFTHAGLHALRHAGSCCCRHRVMHEAIVCVLRAFIQSVRTGHPLKHGLPHSLQLHSMSSFTLPHCTTCCMCSFRPLTIFFGSPLRGLHLSSALVMNHACLHSFPLALLWFLFLRDVYMLFCS